ncbi:hypothetical protein HPP92_016764 [Vanilla planifolia]|uniref:SPRY domain-containing protein n=1 Tax=Vanilla planifolia TaxID=51239 RepID=A0A835QPC9_VANPL|nr:hypothetical protein HPP92_016764 [Vanilla planifolia]
MKLWVKIIAGVIPGAAVLLLALLLLLRWHRRRHRQLHIISPQSSPNQSLESSSKTKFDGIKNVHLAHKSGSSARNSLRFHHLRHPHHDHDQHHHQQHQVPHQSTNQPFNWDEHPRLVAEATETGWPRFAFSSSSVLRSPSAPLWTLCTSCNVGVPHEAANGSWDIRPESSEFMQTLRLNAGLTKPNVDDPSFSWAITSLPLPGPALAGGSFPQEAYFEITILYLQPRRKALPSNVSKRAINDIETDRAKLIRENSITSFINSPSKDQSSTAEQGRTANLALSLGLTNRASLPTHSMPGTFPGSISFHSDGSVYLDGRKLVFGSEKAGWADVNRVIGCGYEPSRKKVFFTVDSQLAHVIRCSSEAYGFPLYPVMATSADAMILVNMGQAPFKYAPANATRTSNPCFVRLLPGEDAGGEAAGIMDSQELFSVAPVEVEWRDRGRRSRQQQNKSGSKNSTGISDDGVDGESDLFEIALQS